MSLALSEGVYRSPLLEQFSWLDHGFGGRNAPHWPPQHHATVVQVHGETVVTVDSPGAHGEADALTTSTAGLYLSVRTADCLPLLIVDARQRRIAAVHARVGSEKVALSKPTPEKSSLQFSQTFARPGSATVWVTLSPKTLELDDEKVDEYFREIDAPQDVREPVR